MATYYKGNGCYANMYVPTDDSFPYAMNLITRSYVCYKEFLENFSDFNGTFEELQEGITEWFYSGWNEVEIDSDFMADDTVPMLDSRRDVYGVKV